MNKMTVIRDYAKKHHIPIMQDEGLRFLVDFIAVKNYHDILELGSAIGYSALQMALVDDDNKVITIEKDKDLFDIASNNITAMKLDHRIRVFNMDAYDYEPEEQFDFIFIDAAKAQYHGLFDKFYPYLRPGGACFFDNMEFHGYVAHPENTNNRNTRQLARKLREFRTFIEEAHELSSEYYPEVGDGILIVYQKGNDDGTFGNESRTPSGARSR